MKANHSAPYIGFKNKMLHFSDDIEYVDILYSTIKKEHIPSNATKLFFNQSPKNIRAYQDTRYVMIIGYKSLDI